MYDPYRNLARVVRRSDRILRRMVAARMITEEEYRSALAEEPNVEGLSRKIEKTMASPPEEPPQFPESAVIPEPGTSPPDASTPGTELEEGPGSVPSGPAPSESR